MSGERFPILGVLGAVLIVVALAVLVGLASCQATADQPTQPTGIEIDVDRAKPRPPLKTQPKKAAPAPRSKR